MFLSSKNIILFPPKDISHFSFFFLRNQLAIRINKSFICIFISTECDSQCSEEPSPMEVAPSPHVLAIAALVPVQKSSPERRNQKEIVAGEERPKFLTTTKTEDSQGELFIFFQL